MHFNDTRVCYLDVTSHIYMTAEFSPKSLILLRISADYPAARRLIAPASAEIGLTVIYRGQLLVQRRRARRIRRKPRKAVF